MVKVMFYSFHFILIPFRFVSFRLNSFMKTTKRRQQMHTTSLHIRPKAKKS